MKENTKSRTIKVDYLARVEGEGALYVKTKGNEIIDWKFKIFEPPRFFEAFLRGRSYKEAPDITARICGICPVAYQMSSTHAMEYIFGVSPTPPIRELRRLLYCGEWIESHVLHVFMLHLPDFLGAQDVLEISRANPEAVQKALKMKKIGNEIVQLLGGREIHPINVRVGGFYKIPPYAQFQAMLPDLQWGRDTAAELTEFIATLDFPEFDQDYEFVALHHPEEYPFNEGRLISNKGLDIAVDEYDHHFEEIHVAHSNALHSVLKERGAYFVGPLARFNLNFEHLSPLAIETAKKINFQPPIQNPFKSILARMLETIFAFEEAIRIIENWQEPQSPSIAYKVKAGTGYGCTEAPRGILYHRYTVDSEGIIRDAKIVPPTSQNQKTIENDLHFFVQKYIELPDDELQWKCEQAIRNYDPCISCATHFLKMKIDRES